MDRYDDKRKRAMRRRNHVARDLANSKYHQRVKKGKIDLPPDVEEYFSDEEF